jgi:hypothetical protein
MAAPHGVTIGRPTEAAAITRYFYIEELSFRLSASFYLHRGTIICTVAELIYLFDDNIT